MIKKLLKATGIAAGAVAGTGLALIAAGYFADKYMPENLKNPTKNKGKLFADGKAQIGAHRAGAGIAPENTPMAFDICLDNDKFNVQELEFDLHMTKDEKLIILHDPTLDRTTDAKEKYNKTNILPGDLTYEEISKLNPGEGFTADDGTMPYKGLRGNDIPEGLRIPLLEEIIDKIESKGEYLYSIDIKDKGEAGKKAADKLIELCKEKGISDRVIVASFNTDITNYLTKNYPDVQRSVGVLEGVFFYFAYALNIKLDKNKLHFKAVQLPANQFKIIRLGTERFINYCHNLGIAVQYWTIDDIDEIKRLSDIGADNIITNVPDKMYNLLYK